jgi:hypothetical protein
MASEGLRHPSGRMALQEPQRGFSFLVFDLLSALASTVSSCRSALGTRAQIRDLGIDSRGSFLWSASVTDNFGNRDNLGRGATEQEKAWEKPYLVGSKGYSGGAYHLGY